MTNPLVSVVVPVYKTEPFLRRCVDSLLAQTHRELEIILVDDGSPDNCPAICDEYAAKDARVRVIHQVNGGVSAARNAGIEAATGKYLVFVDSDDTVPLRAYELLTAAAEKNHADLVQGKCTVISLFGDHEYFDLPRRNGSHISSLGCNAFYLRRLVVESGVRYSPLTMAEDMLFHAQMTPFVRHRVTIKESVYEYNINSKSATSCYNFRNYCDHISASEQIVASFRAQGKQKWMREEYYGFIISSLERIFNCAPISERQEWFAMFSDYVRRSQCSLSESQCRRAFGMTLADFLCCNAATYFSEVGWDDDKQHILCLYKSGKMGASVLLTCARSWLRFKYALRKENI